MPGCDFRPQPASTLAANSAADADFVSPLPEPDAEPDIVKALHDKCAPELTPAQRADLNTLFRTYQDDYKLFSFGELGRTHVLKHQINTGDAQPFRQYRQVPFNKRAIVEDGIQDLLKTGSIEPSHSQFPWCSPIVVVKKKCGQWRLCIDFRKLNEFSVNNV